LRWNTLSIAIVQLSASDVRNTISMAAWFGTGSVPGIPRQTGQTRVFGSPPNATGQRQNIPTLGTYFGIALILPAEKRMGRASANCPSKTRCAY
jgi:hypothetical protein